MGNPKKKVEIPEGEVRLPAAENMFESTTIYFGKNPAVSLVCNSRAEKADISCRFPVFHSPRATRAVT